ncbi:Alpha-taxilin, partial [Talaromyces pinophilus]
ISTPREAAEICAKLDWPRRSLDPLLHSSSRPQTALNTARRGNRARVLDRPALFTALSTTTPSAAIGHAYSSLREISVYSSAVARYERSEASEIIDSSAGANRHLKGPTEYIVSAVIGHANTLRNLHSIIAQLSRSIDTMASTNMSKKAKGKKVADPNETSKLLAAKISQLEQDAAGEKDQEAEIEREVKKATRDLNQLLSNIESPMTRLETVHKKYTELLAEMKKLDRDYTKSKKRADQLQKDQDKGKSELNKTATMKDKLEKLCRELTKENKKVKDENKKLEETEKRARMIVNERLSSLLTDIQDVMAPKETRKYEKMDIDMDDAIRTKIKTIGEKFELREFHFKALLRSKDAEIQSLVAKYEEQKRAAESEASRCRALTAQVSTFSHTEVELRSQLNIYVEKFKQVEDTLNNSNELFLTFRKEMEEMSKKTKRLEKENLTLTRKHDQTNRNILEMAEERNRNQQELEKYQKKCHHLEALCRRMQEQGRGHGFTSGDANHTGDHALSGDLEGDEEGTQSDYDDEDDDYEDEDEDEDGVMSDEEEYEAIHQRFPEQATMEKPVFGPPPPPAMAEARTNGNRISF